MIPYISCGEHKNRSSAGFAQGTLHIQDGGAFQGSVLTSAAMDRKPWGMVVTRPIFPNISGEIGEMLFLSMPVFWVEKLNTLSSKINMGWFHFKETIRTSRYGESPADLPFNEFWKKVTPVRTGKPNPRQAMGKQVLYFLLGDPVADHTVAYVVMSKQIKPAKVESDVIWLYQMRQ